MSESLPTVAVVGGTGNLGAALARRLAAAGRRVLIGSRDRERARAAAAQLGPGLGHGTNAEVAAAADVVIVAVPFASQQGTLQDIAPHVAGKIVVDTTVPLVPPKVMRVQLPPEGSAAVLAQQVLGPGVRVVSAFHNVAAHKLAADGAVECDVLVFGDDRKAREVVVALADACGLRGLHGGALVNSAAAEALTSVIIFINKTYAVDGAGVRITGQLVPPAG
ncbi:MAG: NADPH-dependent F420 reductase [Steroidobacteraceae bacterium]|jgi:NADPH-dependent F420 reductase|nr:NADPH-dependent F420 reductase [Steroidobacteraceae bacterium]